MGQLNRVLDADLVPDLAAYEAQRGGEALRAARASEPVAVIEVVEASGLRGRGGAGFPTGTKWRTVAGLGGAEPGSVVVNAAEGEPGTLKDRTLLRRNPYKVLEGALIAAHAIAAARVIVGMKESAGERARVEAAAAEMDAAGWLTGIELTCVASSNRYLLGEETALLEALNGRPPFPRIAPPYRAGTGAGIDDEPEAAGSTPSDSEGQSGAPSTLVNNAETLANVPAIVLDGPEAFRSLGTSESPGTIVCTITGGTERAGVGEFELGTPLREVINELGGPGSDRRVVALLSGTANPLLPARALDAPLSWEGLEAAGGGLGSAGFIVVNDDADVVAVAHGVSRFLSVESCGQCTPCKHDGRAITSILDRVRSSEPDDDDLDRLRVLTTKVTDGARCFLAQQHQNIVEGLLQHFPEALAAHAEGRVEAAEPFPIVPLLDIVDGEAVLALDQLDLAHDWADGSSTSPSDRIDVRAD